ncbi:hypothetical protein ABPG72_005987 [Tetrahymena utriculariae]
MHQLKLLLFGLNLNKQNIFEIVIKCTNIFQDIKQDIMNQYIIFMNLHIFQIKKRQMSTSILSLINVIGVGIGFLFPSFVVSATYSENTKNKVDDLMFIQAILISACCKPTVIFFREKPPIPPRQEKLFIIFNFTIKWYFQQIINQSFCKR